LPDRCTGSFAEEAPEITVKSLQEETYLFDVGSADGGGSGTCDGQRGGSDRGMRGDGEGSGGGTFRAAMRKRDEEEGTMLASVTGGEENVDTAPVGNHDNPSRGIG
jgi:hypothetical protein